MVKAVRLLTSPLQDRNKSCLEAESLAEVHLKDVRAKLKELRELEKSIASFVESCAVRCEGGPGPDCVILEDLSYPAILTGRQK